MSDKVLSDHASESLAAAITVAVASTERREQFASRVRALLAPHGVALASSELGRNATQAVWIITVSMQLARETILTMHVLLNAAVPPFAEDTAAAVAKRVIAYLHSRGLGA